MAKKRIDSFIWAIIAFTTILLLASLASLASFAASADAQAQEFSLIKKTTPLSVCPGSTLLVETALNSASGGTFTISQEGDASKFSISVPTGAVLMPGESKTIFSYVTPPSVTKKGTYSFSITATSGGKWEKASYSIIVEDCRASSLSLEPVKEICPGEIATFMATLSNKGKFEEDYTIKIEGPASSWATLSDSFVRLSSGSQKNIFVFITPPLDKAGKFDFTLSASSKSGVFTSASSSVNVLPCYNFELSSEKALYSLCEAEKLTVPLTLENKGSVKNTFLLNLNAQDFIVLEEDTIVLAPSERKTINLILNPPYGTQGDFQTEVNIRSKLGDVKKVLTLTIRVEKCYGVQTVIPSDSLTVCNSFKAEESVTIRNIGRKTAVFSVNSEGTEFATLDKNSLTLAPEAEGIVKLKIAPSERTIAKTYTIKVTVVDSVSGASASDSLSVKTLDRKECFMPSITLTQKSIEVAKDSSAAVQFTIENKGKERASYILELSGNALPFVQINPSSLSLDAGKSETVFLHLAPSIATAEGNYLLTVTARVKDSQISSSETLSIKVLPAAELPEITPTITGATTIEKKSPLDVVRDFFRRLFGIGVKEKDQEEVQEGITEEVTTEITGEITKQLEETEKQRNITEEQQPTEPVTEKKSLWQRLKEYFGYESPKKETNESAEETQTQETQETPKQTSKEISDVLEKTEEAAEEKETEEQESEQETAETISETQKAPLITGQAVKGFFSAYVYHIIAAVILVVLIVLIATGYWKKIVDFFIEEEEPAKQEIQGKRKSNKR